MTKLYRIEELATSGWTLYDERSLKLTKEQASVRLKQIINEGHNPNELRVRRDD
tara:strand:+ start:222 stop:383 length:162 start_codon:yes stop_codon:yes gene_type:complete